ncbi:hypothetical protein BDZ45DRAFT_732320, partial [Acephala macrosclerotiorum]
MYNAIEIRLVRMSANTGVFSPRARCGITNRKVAMRNVALASCKNRSKGFQASLIPIQISEDPDRARISLRTFSQPSGNPSNPSNHHRPIKNLSSLHYHDQGQAERRIKLSLHIKTALIQPTTRYRFPSFNYPRSQQPHLNKLTDVYYPQGL